MQKMTAKEAIERIRKDICNGKEGQRFCNDNCMYGTEYCAYSMAIQALEGIQKYKEAEEQGLLLRLPCKVGDTVWWATRLGVLERYVSSMDLIRTDHIAIKLQPLGLDGEHYHFPIIVFLEDFGEIVFTTRAEAEAALEKLKGEEHE